MVNSFSYSILVATISHLILLEYILYIWMIELKNIFLFYLFFLDTLYIYCITTLCFYISLKFKSFQNYSFNINPCSTKKQKQQKYLLKLLNFMFFGGKYNSNIGLSY